MRRKERGFITFMMISVLIKSSKWANARLRAHNHISLKEKIRTNRPEIESKMKGTNNTRYVITENRTFGELYLQLVTTKN